MSISKDLWRDVRRSVAVSDTSDGTFAYTRHARACAPARPRDTGQTESPVRCVRAGNLFAFRNIATRTTKQRRR